MRERGEQACNDGVLFSLLSLVFVSLCGGAGGGLSLELRLRLKLGLLAQSLGPGGPVDILPLALAFVGVVAILKALLTAISAGVLLSESI